jgi:predicted transcriptional regulator
MTKKQSPLNIIAIICTKLVQGVPEEDIRKSLDEFALENNWIVKQEDGRYKLTDYGKVFVSEFQA